MLESKQIFYNTCIQIIENEFKQYFSCRQVVDYLIAQKYDVSLGYVVHTKERIYDPYTKDRKELSRRVTRIIADLNKKNLIKKHSKLYWRKINHENEIKPKMG